MAAFGHARYTAWIMNAPLTLQLSRFAGPVWRLLPQSLVNTPTAPARAPVGRFHHSGQIAAYASLSAEGAGVAIRRYRADGMSRSLVAMWLAADRVADARGVPSASMVWQETCWSDAPSPTWAISDTARQAGAQAMIYASRSRPDLSHVVVFAPDCLRYLGPTIPFDG
jgi:hypothetical protein